jgi:hypothetical protein
MPIKPADEQLLQAVFEKASRRLCNAHMGLAAHLD